MGLPLALFNGRAEGAECAEGVEMPELLDWLRDVPERVDVDASRDFREPVFTY